MKRELDCISFRVWDGRRHEPIWYNAVLEESGGVLSWRLRSPRPSRYRSDWLDRYCNSCNLYFTSYHNGDRCPCCEGTEDVSGVDIEDELFGGNAPF